MSKILIFSGYNQRANLAFIRTLSKHKIPFIIVANGENDTIFQTEYHEFVKAIRIENKLDYNSLNQVNEKLRSENITDNLTILPNSEYLNRFFLTQPNLLKNFNWNIPLVPEQMYSKISDKKSFCDLCAENNLKIPGLTRTDSFPLVAKPNYYFSKNGGMLAPVLIETREQFNSWKQNSNKDDYYLQEFIGGDSYYLLFYFFKDQTKRPISFSQKNLIQQHQGKSIVAAISSDLHHNKIARHYENLFKSIGFYGLVMVELKYYKNEYFMIEANPRLWGPSQLFVDAGVPLFDAFLYDLGFLQESNFDFSVSPVRYFWFGGVLETLRSNNRPAYHNIEKTIFETDFAQYFDADIYKRKDSLKLYLNELVG